MVAVKLYVKIFEVPCMLFKDPCNEFLRLYFELIGLQLYWGAMGVICAAIDYLLAYQSKKAHKYVCLDVFYQMPAVQWSIGIR